MQSVFSGRPARVLALAILGLAALGSGVAAAAQSDQSSQSRKLPPVLERAVANGQIKVTRQFKTDAPGIKGYVIENNGQHQIVYGDGDYLITGHIISGDGQNLSDVYNKKYLPKPDVGKVVKKIEATGHLIDQGPSDAPLIYVFADPNCIYCHRFYQQAEPLVKQGRLRLRWALVGFLKSSSMGRAAAILSAKNPLAALEKNENGFDDSSEDGAIKPMDPVPGSLKKVINTHYKQMAAAGGNGTPTLLYRNSSGQWDVKVGMPPAKWLKNYAAKKH